MATIIWRGDAQAVAQVTNVTFSGWTAGDIFTATINGKDLAYTTVDTSASTVVAAFVSLIGQYDNDIPEWAEVSAAADGTTLVVTGPTSGKPFTMTVTDDGAGSATVTTPTAATGPNHWDNAENWSTGAVPVSTDDVYFENNTVDCLYGLAQSAVTLTSLHIKSSYTGRIGLPNYDSDLGYYEYRATELAISATNLYVGEGDGAGSSRIKINVGSAACTCEVYNTATPEDDGVGSFVLRGTNVANIIRVVKGNVGIGTNKAGDDADLATLQVSYQDSQDTDATVRVGAAVSTLTAVNQSGGTLYVECDMGTLTQEAGTSYILGASSPTTVDVLGGTCYYRSSGTLGQAYVAQDATLEFYQIGTRTVTNCSIYSGATLYDRGDTVTWTNPIALVRCGIPDVTLDLGTNGTIAPT